MAEITSNLSTDSHPETGRYHWEVLDADGVSVASGMCISAEIAQANHDEAVAKLKGDK